MFCMLHRKTKLKQISVCEGACIFKKVVNADSHETELPLGISDGHRSNILLALLIRHTR